MGSAEAKAVAALNILAIHDFDEHDGTAFAVLDETGAGRLESVGQYSVSSFFETLPSFFVQGFHGVA